MTIIEGHYFNGRYPVAMAASLDIGRQETAITADSHSSRFMTNELIVSPRVGASFRFVRFPDGGQFSCADHALLDSFAQESKSEGLVAWLEARWMVALACVAVIAVVLFVGYFFGLLKQKGHSPNAFASLMEKLAAEHGDAMDGLAWISTHPVTSERVEKARHAAAD